MRHKHKSKDITSPNENNETIKLQTISLFIPSASAPTVLPSTYPTVKYLSESAPLYPNLKSD